MALSALTLKLLTLLNMKTSNFQKKLRKFYTDHPRLETSTTSTGNLPRSVRVERSKKTMKKFSRVTESDTLRRRLKSLSSLIRSCKRLKTLSNRTRGRSKIYKNLSTLKPPLPNSLPNFKKVKISFTTRVPVKKPLTSGEA